MPYYQNPCYILYIFITVVGWSVLDWVSIISCLIWTAASMVCMQAGRLSMTQQNRKCCFNHLSRSAFHLGHEKISLRLNQSFIGYCLPSQKCSAQRSVQVEGRCKSSLNGAKVFEGSARRGPERGPSARGPGQRQIRDVRADHTRPGSRLLHLLLLPHPPILPHQDGPGAQFNWISADFLTGYLAESLYQWWALRRKNMLKILRKCNWIGHQAYVEKLGETLCQLGIDTDKFGIRYQVQILHVRRLTKRLSDWIVHVKRKYRLQGGLIIILVATPFAGLSLVSYEIKIRRNGITNEVDQSHVSD